MIAPCTARHGSSSCAVPSSPFASLPGVSVARRPMPAALGRTVPPASSSAGTAVASTEAVPSRPAALTESPRPPASPAPVPPRPDATQTAPVPVPPVPHVPRPVHVLGLGDSVVFSNACDCTPFVTRYANELAAKVRQRVMCENPRISPRMAGHLASCCSQSPPRPISQWRRKRGYRPRDQGLLGAIHRLRGARPTMILSTGYWNVFPDGSAVQRRSGSGYIERSRAVARRWPRPHRQRAGQGRDRAARPGYGKEIAR